MKFLFVVSSFLLCTQSLYSQETKLITKRTAGKPGPVNAISTGTPQGFVEEYYVLVSDETIRHGTYVKYRNGTFAVQVLEAGNYQNGERHGTWEIYQDDVHNSLKTKGQYVSGKKNGVWTYYHRSAPGKTDHEVFGSNKKPDSVGVTVQQRTVALKTAGMYLNDKRVGDWNSFDIDGQSIQTFNFSRKELVHDVSIKDTLELNRNRKALFLGGTPGLVDFLKTEFDMDFWVMEKIHKDTTFAIVSFTVNRDGHLVNPLIESSNSSNKLEKELIEVVMLTDNHWITALSNGEPVDSIYKVRIDVFRHASDESRWKTFRIQFKPILE